MNNILKKEHICLKLDAKDKKAAIEKLSDMLLKTGSLTDKDAFIKDVMDREAVSATGIGNGIAIPHGKSVYVSDTTAAIGILKNPVEWESADDKLIQFIVLLAVNENDKGSSHVRLLSQMARKLASAETCERLLNAKNEDEIINIFSE